MPTRYRTALGQAIHAEHLGQARAATGDKNQARTAWSAALAIYESLKADSEIADIRSALASLVAKRAGEARNFGLVYPAPAPQVRILGYV